MKFTSPSGNADSVVEQRSGGRLLRDWNIRGEDKNAIAALKLAILLHPTDAIANYKLGRAFRTHRFR
jgi:hypothetical protein